MPESVRALVMALVLAPAVAPGCMHFTPAPDRALRPRDLCAEGIPNLRAVVGTGERVVLRGGQPTEAGWRCLRDALHVEAVVKLNDPAESAGQGEDQPARALGLRVTVATMPPRDYGISLRSLGELGEGPTVEQAAVAVASLAVGQGVVYVHCSHGRDRTGLVVGLYRVFVENAAPEAARAEMLAAGFRRINRGLDRFWHLLFRDGTVEERMARQADFRARVGVAIARIATP